MSHKGNDEIIDNIIDNLPEKKGGDKNAISNN